MKAFLTVCALALVMTVLVTEPAFASSSDGGLPWEEGITKLKDSLTGPLATGLGVIGIFTAGAILMWGGDLNGLFQKLVVMILVLSLVICANKILTYFYTASGATIAAAPAAMHPLTHYCDDARLG